MSHTHVAGAIHADVSVSGPGWLRRPTDVNALVDGLWSSGVRRRPDGELEVAGVPVTALAAEVGTPAYVFDEADLRERARGFAEAFAGWRVYYAGKSFLSKDVARWVVEEGLYLDVCTGGELAVALAAGIDPARIGFHGNNKSLAELQAALEAGVGRIIVDSFIEIARLAELAAARGVQAPVLVRVTAGVEAHTHEYIATAHEDQKFGFSIVTGDAMRAVEECLGAPGIDLRGIHSHIGSQIFETAGFEVAVRRTIGLLAAIAERTGQILPELDLGGGFGIAYTTLDDPRPAAELAEHLNAMVEAECRSTGLPRPELSIEPGRAISGPAALMLYEVGTVKPVVLAGGGVRTYVSVDGGMSDNIRTALYAAEYSATVANRASDAAPVLCRVVGKHCESGDIVVRDEFLPGDIAPGDLIAVPGAGAYARSMASNYNHVPRPPVVAVADGRWRTLLRRETVDDLLALDMG
ncbi:diaminopimelate decarboxylase [Naumannella halotolerans]|uniref:diaminopimelate decarboxylase n=1 Tax=Naumannella halotolerans TaxID=993414 RepID=UPI00370D5842